MRVIFLTFHYKPSNEVGARRPTALCEALTEQGHQTCVVSAFGGAPSDTLVETAAERLHFYPVPEPRKRLIPFLVRVKSLLRGLSMRRVTSASVASDPAAGPRSPHAAAQNADRGWIAEFILHVADTIDSYKLWSWRAARVGMRVARGAPDCVVCSTGPPMTNHIGAYMVSLRRGIPLVVDLRDPWVIGGEEAFMKSGFLLEISRFFERRALSRAAAITVTSDYLAKALSAAKPELKTRIHVIRNGYDGLRRAPMEHTGHRLSMLFAGELYLNRDPFGLLEALERLLWREDVDPSKIELTFIGQCEVFRNIRLRDWMRGKRCDAVTRILPPVRASELQPYTESATLLVNFAQGQKRAIPAKSYEHMASGREMLIFCEKDSATGQLLNGIHGVSIVESGDSTQIDNALADLYRRHVVQGRPSPPSDEDAAPFSRSLQSDRFVNVLKGVVAKESVHP